jgi:nicotinate-nucleotide adenylyltransferase
VRPLGIFGGTFDPVHNGHLRTAIEVADVLDLERVLLIPGGDPPHRAPPVADAATRRGLLVAAIADEPRLAIDERELCREGPSYTVLTLEELRRERGAQPLLLILGMDAFAGLATWHRWTELIGLAHMVVAHRPGWAPPDSGPVGTLWRERGATDSAALAAAPAGRVLLVPTTQLDIASSRLREMLREGRDPRYLMPEAVRRMIHETGIYARKR